MRKTKHGIQQRLLTFELNYLSHYYSIKKSVCVCVCVNEVSEFGFGYCNFCAIAPCDATVTLKLQQEVKLFLLLICCYSLPLLVLCVYVCTPLTL